MQQLISRENKERIVHISEIIEQADITKYTSEKKRLQQNIIPDLVQDILNRRRFQYKRIRSNRFKVETTIGTLNIRCCNYFDEGMNRAIMEEEARDVVRFIIVSGHETSSPPNGIIYFNLTNTKRKSREDLYNKTLNQNKYNELDTYLSSFVPVTS